VPLELRTETEDLELQYNDIVFCRDDRRPRAKEDTARQVYSEDAVGVVDYISLPTVEEKPVDTAIRFLQHTPLYSFSWLQTITIKPLPDETPKPAWEHLNGLRDFSQIGSFARIARCPGLAVRYMLPRITSRHPEDTLRFIGKCLLVRSAVSGLEGLTDALLPAHIAQEMAYSPQHIRAKGIGVHHHNFRMIPNDTVGESWIRRAVEGICEEQMSGRVLQLWIYYAAKWIAEEF
jgi:hypothetical protein